MIGTVQARYRILRKLGEGAMGEVYLAEHLSLGRKEAIKTLLPEVAASPEFVHRFRREARATNRVQHPNIISVYDFGQLPDSRFYLAMEYAEGERLDAVLRRIGAFPVSRALHVLHQLAEAVDFAHSRGVVHRDLKPTNLILVDHRGHPDTLKVLDFGIAKIIAPEYVESIGVTKQGEIFGTPAYMPPEQWAGAAADPRCDLYAIGCIAYEMLTGDVPFHGRRLQLMQQHLHDVPVPPSQKRPSAAIPEELDRLVLRCLEKKVTARFASGRELAAELEAVPGFRTAKRASRSHHSLPAFSADYDGPADTVIEDTAPVDANAGTAFAGQLSLDELVTQYQGALLEVGETIVDLDTHDVALMVAVARVNEARDELAGAQRELDALDVRLAELDQATREREAGLRFTLGELAYEQDQRQARGEPANADLTFQIAEIEVRLSVLTKELRAQVGELTARQDSLVVGCAHQDEAVGHAYRELEQRVDAAAIALGGHEVVELRVADLHALRDVLQRRSRA